MRWASFVSGRVTKWLVVLAWVAILGLAAPFGGKLFKVTTDSFATFLPASAESTKVIEAQQAFPGGNSTQAAVVYYRASGITDADRQRAQRDLTGLANRFGGNGAGERVLPSRDGAALVYQVPISLQGVTKSGEAQKAAVTAIRDAVGTGGDGLEIKVTGPSAVTVDSLEIFGHLEGTLLLVPVIVVGLLLLLIYRSPVLFLAPLISVAVSYQLASAVVYGLVRGPGIVLNSLGAGVLGILVYGAGTDYALLLIARYREELRRHEDRHVAMRFAVQRCRSALVASASTVALGLLCLLVADTRSIRALGPVSAVGVIAALLAVTTLLPALLVIAGRWVFWPLIPRVGSASQGRRGLWPRVAGLVSRRPHTMWVATSLLVLAGWLGLVSLNTPQHTMFRSPPNSVIGQDLIVAHFPAGASTPVDIIAPTASADQIVTAARQVPDVVEVHQVATSGTLVAFQATVNARPNSKREYTAIRALRTHLHPLGVLVGGRSATNMDLDETNNHDAAMVIPLVLAVILVILAVLLRALVAPVVLILTVILSFGAALGISIAVFEHLFHWSGQEASLPVLSFVFLVALGVDYNIFLMSRVREETRQHGTHTGAVRGLVQTGNVISSAGLVLAATFSVLASLPVVNVAELGFVVALGVLLDTLLVRSVLVPALTIGIGQRIWWPSGFGTAKQDPADIDVQPAFVSERIS
jgi:RND superfamily putative drug exporter